MTLPKAPMPDSEFYMWRALFAFAMADGELSAAELDVLHEYKEYVHFSARQLEILRDDFAAPKNAEDMYKKISADEDKHRFCIMARALAWSEGDLGKQEERILKHVSCLKSKEHSDLFESTREHPALESYVDRYSHSGTLGFMQAPRIVELRA